MTPILLDLALKAGFSNPIEGWMGEAYEERLERFAAIITAANREAFAKIQFESLLQAIKIEREACAKVADQQAENEPYGHAKFRCANIAEAIRARGNT